MSSEYDEVVLQLEEKVSQSRLELREPRVARPAFEIEEEEKTLKEALAAKKERLRQLRKAFDDFLAKSAIEFPHKGAQTAYALDKLGKLRAKLNERNQWCEAENAKLDKLESEIEDKWEDLIDFLETSQKKSKITDDVKPYLRLHYDSYMKTLERGDDDYRMLKKYVRFYLQPSYADQKKNEMFAGVDCISPIFAAALKVLNFFLGDERKWVYRQRNSG